MNQQKLTDKEMLQWMKIAGISTGYTNKIYFYFDKEGNFSVETESEMEAMGYSEIEMNQFQSIIPCEYF